MVAVAGAAGLFRNIDSERRGLRASEADRRRRISALLLGRESRSRIGGDSYIKNPLASAWRKGGLSKKAGRAALQQEGHSRRTPPPSPVQHPQHPPCADTPRLSFST